MKLLDSNILIYSSEPPFANLRPLVNDPANFYSAISTIEVLGFPKITLAEEQYFTSVFRILQKLPISDAIIEKATEFRRLNLKLGDALIAATALLNNLELYTRNVSDFSKVPGLKVFNPIP